MGMPLNRQGGRVRAPWGEGRAKIENSSRRHPRKFVQKRLSGGEEVLAGKWGGLFLGYLLRKKIIGSRGSIRRPRWPSIPASPTISCAPASTTSSIRTTSGPSTDETCFDVQKRTPARTFTWCRSKLTRSSAPELPATAPQT